MTKLHAWVKTLSPQLQTLYYAVESSVVVAIVLLLSGVYAALQSPQGISAFDWHAQIRTAEVSVATGVVKALLDLFKGYSTPAAPPPTNGGQNG